MEKLTLELGITVYQVILLVVGYFGALWGVIRYVLAKQEGGDKVINEKVEATNASISKQLNDIRQDYIRREEFEREMNRLNNSLTSMRDEVIGSSAAQAQSMNNLTARIDAWMLNNQKAG